MISETSLSQIVLNDSTQKTPSKDNIEKPLSSLSDSVWSYTPTSQNGDIFNTSILSSLQRASKSFVSNYSLKGTWDFDESLFTD